MLRACRSAVRGKMLGRYSVVTEATPLYPDTREELAYLRANFSDKGKRRFKQYGTNEPAQLWKRMKTKGARTNHGDGVIKGNGEISIKKLSQLLKSKLIIDQETGLAYGFHFDDAIAQQKRNQQSKTLDFGEDMLSIFNKLGYLNKDELLFLNRYSLAEVESKKFHERAKLLIFNSILQLVLYKKFKPSGINKPAAVQLDILSQDQLQKLLVIKATDENDIDGLLKQIEKLNIPKEKIETLSMYLSKTTVLNHIVSSSKSAQKSMDFFGPQELDNFFRDDPFQAPYESFNLQSFRSVTRTLHSMSNMSAYKDVKDLDEEIASKIRAKYYESKKQLFADNQLPTAEFSSMLTGVTPELNEDELFNEKVKNLSKGDPEGFKPKKLNEDEFEPWKHLRQYKFEYEERRKATEMVYAFKGPQIDHEIGLIERKLRLFDKKSPTYSDLMMKVDDIMAKIPLKLKNELREIDENVEITSVDLKFNHHDLLWKNFGMDYEKYTVLNGEDMQEEAEDEVEPEDEERTAIDLALEQFKGVELNTMLRNMVDPTGSFQEKSIDKDDIENDKELQMFSAIDNQPFYKHYVQDILRLNQDLTGSLNAQGIDLPLSMNFIDFFENDRPKLHLATQLKYGLKKTGTQVDPEEAEKQDRPLGIGSGSRKDARASCWIVPGSGKILVNNREFTEYFAHHQRFKAVLPFAMTFTACQFDVSFRTWGGGVNCQADACSIAAAKALVQHDRSFLPLLLKSRLLVVDPRQVERKKTGLYKARRKWTYKRR